MAAPVELIADAIVEHLEAAELPYPARIDKPEVAELKVEQHGVRVQVIPIAGGDRQKIGRRLTRRQYSVNLYATAGLSQQRKREDMTAFVDALLDTLEFEPMGGKTYSGIEEISLYDRTLQKETASMFGSLHRITYTEEYSQG